ncbi:MAG: sensor histidine kinase [Candidatus Rokubacteria bacterium]|nr:sensor histidine kinase [Candidatus Rokubacteria bacterium]
MIVSGAWQPRVASAWRLAGRLPLFYKILLGNSVIVALGAVAGTIVTVWHVRTFPDDYHYELIAVFATAGLILCFVVHYGVLRLALAPLDRLQAAVDGVRSGDLDARVAASPLDDERFTRLADTFNQMVATIARGAQESRRLSQRILEAQEDERQRVARELHDESAQSLTLMLVRLRVMELSEDPAQIRQHVHELRELTARALEEIRRIALELRPKILEDLGLGEALAWRVDEVNASGAVRATIQLVGIERRLPRDVELALYRIAQEALTNVARHAGAEHARLMLVQRDGIVSLAVEDDGAGFDVHAEEARAGGLGLSGMRERMTLVGGTLHIESAPGRGTRVTAAAPASRGRA